MTRAHLIAVAAMLVAASAAQASRPADGSALRTYVRARAADAAGDPETAAHAYADVLATVPGDAGLATQAYRQALNAGDFALAARAAAIVAAAPEPPPDARLFILSLQITERNWKAAGASIDQIEREHSFAFLAPLLRAWVEAGARNGDPLARLKALPAGGVAAAYAPEHRAYLLLAAGRLDEGAAAAAAPSDLPQVRAVRLRIAAAAMLIAMGRRDLAATLLTGDTPPIVAARARLAAGQPIRGAVATPADGVAELFLRLAVDVDGQHATLLALSLARMGAMLAPANAEAWLLTGELLSEAGQPDAAATAVAHVAADDVYAGAARTARIRLAVERGDKAGALTMAQAAAAAPGATIADLTRVGDILADMGSDREAAAAYAKAVALAGTSAGGKDDLWQTLLLQGGALERAGEWADARTVLARAAARAPDQAVVLNYLGYAQLSRRENLAQAETLIERASRLKPDDAAIADSLGWAWYVRGDVPKAIGKLESAAKASPADPTVNEHLGDAYWGAGRRYEARYAWSAALVHASASDALRLRSKIAAGWSAQMAAP